MDGDHRFEHHDSSQALCSMWSISANHGWPRNIIIRRNTRFFTSMISAFVAWGLSNGLALLAWLISGSPIVVWQAATWHNCVPARYQTLAAVCSSSFYFLGWLALFFLEDPYGVKASHVVAFTGSSRRQSGAGMAYLDSGLLNLIPWSAKCILNYGL